jgi:magnesium-transporting ATPase (P-type)
MFNYIKNEVPFSKMYDFVKPAITGIMQFMGKAVVLTTKIPWLGDLIIQSNKNVFYVMGAVIILILISIFVYRAFSIRANKVKDKSIKVYGLLCERLMKYGYVKQPNQTPLEYYQTIRRSLSQEREATQYSRLLENIDKLEQITMLYNQVHYGKDIDGLDDLEKQIKELSQKI